METNSLTERIIGCIIVVHQTLGPGFVEGIYRRALLIELARQQLKVEVEKQVVIYYRGQRIGVHRLDMVVEDRIIVELKTVESLSKAHYAQLRSYLKATSIALGILVNFSPERADYRRIITR